MWGRVAHQQDGSLTHQRKVAMELLPCLFPRVERVADGPGLVGRRAAEPDHGKAVEEERPAIQVVAAGLGERCGVSAGAVVADHPREPEPRARRKR